MEDSNATEARVELTLTDENIPLWAGKMSQLLNMPVEPNDLSLLPGSHGAGN